MGWTSFTGFNKPGSYSHGYIYCHSYLYQFPPLFCIKDQFIPKISSLIQLELKIFFFQKPLAAGECLESWCFIIIISDGRAKFRLPAQADRSLQEQEARCLSLDVQQRYSVESCLPTFLRCSWGKSLKASVCPFKPRQMNLFARPSSSQES